MARRVRGNAALGKPPYDPKAPRKPSKPVPEEAAKKPAGRPLGYKKAYDELCSRLMLLGMTEEETAKGIGISSYCFKQWKAKYPSFKAACDESGELADARMVKALYHRGLGYSHKAVKIFLPAKSRKPVIVPYTEHYAPDTHAIELWLSNRQGGKWKLKPGEKADEGGDEVKITGGLPEE